MKITIFELFELINNGKYKFKFKYQGKIYEVDYPNISGIYEVNKPRNHENSFFQYFGINRLSHTVEVLEEVEDKEYEDIKELETFRDDTFYNWCTVSENRRIINALIRNQKYILERLEKQRRK